MGLLPDADPEEIQKEGDQSNSPDVTTAEAEDAPEVKPETEAEDEVAPEEENAVIGNVMEEDESSEEDVQPQKKTGRNTVEIVPLDPADWPTIDPDTKLVTLPVHAHVKFAITATYDTYWILTISPLLRYHCHFYVLLRCCSGHFQVSNSQSTPGLHSLHGLLPKCTDHHRVPSYM